MATRDFSDDRVRVLIVDDDKLFAASLSACLDYDDRISVIAIAADIAAAIREVDGGRAEVALVDVNLGLDDGLAVVRALRELRPDDLQILAMSALDSDEYEQAAVSAGALAVLPKSAFVDRGRDEVVRAALLRPPPLPA